MLSNFSDVFDAIPFPLVRIGHDERIQMLNKRAEALFGPNLVGRHYIAALRSPTILDCVEPVVLARQKQSEGVFLATEAGRDTTWHVKAVQVGQGGTRDVLVSFEDRTALQEAGQIRRDFVANVSHELRTPLTALMGFIETLRGSAKDDPEARMRFLSIMEREAGRMNRIVADLLSLSRVEADERMRPTETVDIAGLIDATISSLKPLAVTSQVHVQTNVGSNECIIAGDPDQLAQVFTNLVENAIKYSGPEATVSVDLTGPGYETSLRGQAVTIAVTDTGQGFDPVHITRLTERFYRIDSHRSREMGGTGLGLAIVKHIINRHRGRLRIESTPGQGSRFTVVLPVA